MDEYIEREAAIRVVNGQSSLTMTRSILIDSISKIPAADVAPVVHGRWIGCNGEIVDWDENNHGCPRHSCFCSICKSWLTASDELPVIAYFCPNCGAKMDGGDSDEAD